MTIYTEDDLIRKENEHTLLIYCEDVPGVTSNISNLFSRMGVNITSLIGASSEDSDVYRVIIKCIADENNLEKIVKQLNKLVNIIKVKDSLHTEFLECEMSLIRIDLGHSEYKDVLKAIDHFKGKIINVHENQIIASFRDTPKGLQNIINLLQSFGSIEVVNSGVAVMEMN